MSSSRDIINSLFDPRSSGMIIMQYIELPKDEIQRRFSLVLEQIRMNKYPLSVLKNVTTFRDSDVDTYVSMLYSAWPNRSFTIWHGDDDYVDLLLNANSYRDYEFFRIFALRYAWVNLWDSNLGHIISRMNSGAGLRYSDCLCWMLFERFSFMMDHKGEDVIMIYKYNSVEENMSCYIERKCYYVMGRCTRKELIKILELQCIKGMRRKSNDEIVELLIKGKEVRVGGDGQIYLLRK